MANDIKFESDEGNYVTRAYDFILADDLYLFFKFESPKSKCEIGIAYDLFVSGGDWYVNDGEFDDDEGIINDIIWDKLPETSEFFAFNAAVDAAMRKFNGV